MGINISTIVTGHGTLRSYYHSFKIIDDPNCVCKMGPQITYDGNVNYLESKEKFPKTV